VLGACAWNGTAAPSGLGEMLGQLSFGQPPREKEPTVIRDYFYLCPADMNEIVYLLLQSGKLFFNPPCQLCALIMAIGIE
jgi:hypothetical protein